MAGPDDHEGGKAESLVEEGYDLLHQGEYEAALAIARKLGRMRDPAAFEIEALALAAQDRLEEAVTALERGVAAAPRAWINWQLLGNYRSDLGDYAKAAEAYRRALACPEVDEDYVRLNQAVLADRMGDHAAALAGAEALQDTDLELEAASVRVRALKALGRTAEALALAEDLLAESVEGAEEFAGEGPGEPEPWEAGNGPDEAPAWEDGYDDDEEEAGEGDPDAEALADIAATRGRILFERDGASPALEDSVLESARRFGAGRPLLELLRDMEGARDPDARYYRLLVDVAVPPGRPGWEGVRGYMVSYDVVAESPAAALDRIRAFEGGTGASLRMEEMEDLEPRPEDPLGIYHRSGRMLYGDEDDAE